MMWEESDLLWMRYAIRLAQRAENQGEVPVGAVLVKNNIVLAEGWNRPIQTHDPTAHAEIDALRKAGERLQNYRLVDTTLYVTLEPCVMCIGAIANARVKRLIFGAHDPQRGAVDSALKLQELHFLNHTLETRGGLFADECAQLLKDFFRARRRKST